MRNLISILIGLVALVLVVLAFIPLLGWANWLIIPLVGGIDLSPLALLVVLQVAAMVLASMQLSVLR